MCNAHIASHSRVVECDAAPRSVQDLSAHPPIVHCDVCWLAVQADTDIIVAPHTRHSRAPTAHINHNITIAVEKITSAVIFCKRCSRAGAALSPQPTGFVRGSRARSVHMPAAAGERLPAAAKLGARGASQTWLLQVTKARCTVVRSHNGAPSTAERWTSSKWTSSSDRHNAGAIVGSFGHLRRRLSQHNSRPGPRRPRELGKRTSGVVTMDVSVPRTTAMQGCLPGWR